MLIKGRVLLEAGYRVTHVINITDKSGIPLVAQFDQPSHGVLVTAGAGWEIADAGESTHLVPYLAESATDIGAPHALQIPTVDREQQDPGTTQRGAVLGQQGATPPSLGEVCDWGSAPESHACAHAYRRILHPGG